MRRFALIALVWPLAAQAADPVQGRLLAEQWCANCHAIGMPSQRSVSDAVPTFGAIAVRPGRTAEAIAGFLRVPHAGMPDHGLTLRQSQDLAAFVMEQGAR